MANKNTDSSKNLVLTNLPDEHFGRGGGQGKPRTPSGERKTWKPPAGNSTPSNRGKPASE